MRVRAGGTVAALLCWSACWLGTASADGSSPANQHRPPPTLATPLSRLGRVTLPPVLPASSRTPGWWSRGKDVNTSLVHHRVAAPAGTAPSAVRAEAPTVKHKHWWKRSSAVTPTTSPAAASSPRMTVAAAPAPAVQAAPSSAAMVEDNSAQRLRSAPIKTVALATSSHTNSGLPAGPVSMVSGRSPSAAGRNRPARSWYTQPSVAAPAQIRPAIATTANRAAPSADKKKEGSDIAE